MADVMHGKVLTATVFNLLQLYPFLFRTALSFYSLRNMHQLEDVALWLTPKWLITDIPTNDSIYFIVAVSNLHNSPSTKKLIL